MVPITIDSSCRTAIATQTPGASEGRSASSARATDISLCDHVNLILANLTGDSPGKNEHCHNDYQWRKYVSVSRSDDGELEI